MAAATAPVSATLDSTTIASSSAASSSAVLAAKYGETNLTATTMTTQQQQHSRAPKKGTSPSGRQNSSNNSSSNYLAPPRINADKYRGSGQIREARDRKRQPWKKLLWVKQNYPDNYTDTSFLDTLQRNVNVQAYNFWHLVSDSTVIAQHISSVVLFVTVFIAIFTNKIEPMFVAGGSTLFTVLAWLIWDEWTEMEEKASQTSLDLKNLDAKLHGSTTPSGTSTPVTPNVSTKQTNNNTSSTSSLQVHQRNVITSRSPSPNRRPNLKSKSPNRGNNNSNNTNSKGLNLNLSTQNLLLSSTTTSSNPNSAISPVPNSHLSPHLPLSPSLTPSHSPTSPRMSPGNGYFSLPSPPSRLSRSHRRISTLKSAILIYSTLLGLSPILKSLTETTTSDSIWALSSWLFLVNLLCFDYGLSEIDIVVTESPKKSGEGVEGDANLNAADSSSYAGATATTGAYGKKLPTSLSTTTAMAASVVLASRLTSTFSVFSLLLFSIQIFGLFPLFRRRLRFISVFFHRLLTLALILSSALCVWLVLGYQWAVIWFGVITVGGGGAAYWIMVMQRYKNSYAGPWDAARPIFRKQRWMEL